VRALVEEIREIAAAVAHTLALAHETHRYNPRRFCYAPITPTGRRTDKVTERQKTVSRERGREEEYEDVKYEPIICEPYPIAAYERRWYFGGALLRAGNHPVRGGSKHFQASRNLVVLVIFVAVAVILLLAFGSANVSS